MRDKATDYKSILMEAGDMKLHTNAWHSNDIIKRQPVISFVLQFPVSFSLPTIPVR